MSNQWLKELGRKVWKCFEEENGFLVQHATDLYVWNHSMNIWKQLRRICVKFCQGVLFAIRFCKNLLIYWTKCDFESWRARRIATRVFIFIGKQNNSPKVFLKRKGEIRVPTLCNSKCLLYRNSRIVLSDFLL